MPQISFNARTQDGKRKEGVIEESNINKAAENLENAIDKVLKKGFRTSDLVGGSASINLGCKELGDEILKVLEAL